MLEWGTLTLIEDSPRYLKYATVVIAVLLLSVHESWPWLRMRGKYWYPSLIVGLLAIYFGIFIYAEMTGISKGHPLPGSPSSEGLPKVTAAPPPLVTPSRPRQAITELLAESGALLDIIQKTFIPLENNWRTTVGGQNPERICLDLNASALRDQISGLSERLLVASKAISEILEKNRIDQNELAPLVGYQTPMVFECPPIFASSNLSQYGAQIKTFGDHPPCEEVIKADLSRRYVEMTGSLNSFNIWVTQSQERLSNYRDALRKEARNAP
jgi:hypothetical protein